MGTTAIHRAHLEVATFSQRQDSLLSYRVYKSDLLKTLIRGFIQNESSMRISILRQIFISAYYGKIIDGRIQMSTM